MSDPRQPETAALLKAMKAAERLRGGTDARLRARPLRRLEQALADAERAAGVGRDSRGAPRRINQHGPGARLSGHSAR